jgi:hypothetical protein
VVDPGAVQVEIVCDRFAVGAKSIYGANKLRGDLQRVRVNSGVVKAKMYMNADRNDRKKLTCPSLEFLKLLCHACENSDWCSHYYLTNRNGQSIPCSADLIEDLEVEFDEPPELELDRPEVEFTCDDVRRDTRAIMGVPRRPIEMINMLCHDELYVPMPRVSARDSRALARSHRAMMDEMMRTEPDICASCKRECDCGTCCDICGRPLCDDCWSDAGTGMPELCGIGRCLRQSP